jgi:thioredoxin 1
MAENTSQDSFTSDISSGLVFVDFWADWCGPCKAMAPQYDALSLKHTDALFLKLDIMAAKNIALQYGVRSIPTIIAFNNGKEVSRHIGLQNLDDFISGVANEI